MEEKKRTKKKKKKEKKLVRFRHKRASSPGRLWTYYECILGRRSWKVSFLSAQGAAFAISRAVTGQKKKAAEWKTAGKACGTTTPLQFTALGKMVNFERARIRRQGPGESF